MKIYNLMISNGRWTSSKVFQNKVTALDYVTNLELGQRDIEGDTLKYLFYYSENDAVTLPFHAEGKRIYCSYAWTEFSAYPTNEAGCTWRAIFEQEI